MSCALVFQPQLSCCVYYSKVELVHCSVVQEAHSLAVYSHVKVHCNSRFALHGHIGISVDVQVHLVNATYAEVVRDVRIIMNTSCEIAQLVSSDDGEYIYALTTQQVS